jgi:hypothetical protein
MSFSSTCCVYLLLVLEVRASKSDALLIAIEDRVVLPHEQVAEDWQGEREAKPGVDQADVSKRVSGDVAS